MKTLMVSTIFQLAFQRAILQMFGLCGEARVRDLAFSWQVLRVGVAWCERWKFVVTNTVSNTAETTPHRSIQAWAATRIEFWDKIKYTLPAVIKMSAHYIFWVKTICACLKGFKKIRSTAKILMWVQLPTKEGRVCGCTSRSAATWLTTAPPNLLPQVHWRHVKLQALRLCQCNATTESVACDIPPRQRRTTYHRVCEVCTWDIGSCEVGVFESGIPVK